MKKARKPVLLFLSLLMLLCLTSCAGFGSPKLEITKLSMSDTRVLMIQYASNSDIRTDEGQFRITVSSGEGSLYCYSELENDLEKGRNYISLFNMISERPWSVDGSFDHQGSTVTNSINASDVFALFEGDPTVTVAFVMEEETISEMTLGGEASE